ncbi:MAG: hypothetical protein HZB92_04925 [Euryarchaeota archaeon]|nr:hypothetical protein [Euryarchaeota archaeon]
MGQELSDEEYLEALTEAEYNRRWINEHYSDLAKKFPNRYVCVKRGKIIKDSLNVEAISEFLNEKLDVVCEYIQPHGTAMLL